MRADAKSCLSLRSLSHERSCRRLDDGSHGQERTAAAASLSTSRALNSAPGEAARGAGEAAPGLEEWTAGEDGGAERNGVEAMGLPAAAAVDVWV
jgi:hypothetical protein